MTPALDAERWQQVRATFNELVDLDAETRHKRVAAICEADPDLGALVGELLEADDEADVLLERIEKAFAFEGQRDADPLNLVGTTVSHFKILEPLAAGGMGVVYRAVDTRLQRTIALKLPLPSRHFDPTARQRFLQEARAAGALEHPNICTVYETGALPDGQLFIAMPLYEGETLKARLARAGPLPIDDAIFIANQITEALAAAHEHGIVHRDMKAANVMLLRDGSVKVLDFGISKVGVDELTATRERLGTVAYMAPEQIRGQPIDARADLWALGVLLYEMLAGVRPFAGEYDAAVAHAILNTQPQRLSEIRTDVTPALQHVIATLLCKEPAERYATAREARAALIAAVDNHVIPRPRRTLTRGTVTRWVSVLAVVSVAAIAWALLQSRSDTHELPRRFVVLPFEDRSRSDQGRYLAVGLSDALIRSLASLPSARVPSYASVVPYGASTQSLAGIAREHGAAAIVTGGVARTADRVRVDVQVFSASTNDQIWAEQYETSIEGVVQLQRDIARSIAAVLKLDPDKHPDALFPRLPTANGKAYDLYLQGREIDLRNVSRQISQIPDEDIRSAQAFYSRARDLDPQFALARAHLALTQSNGLWTAEPTPARRDQVRLEAEAALYAQPGLAEAHEALSYYWAAGRKDMAKSIEHMRLAIAASPNDAAYHQMLAGTYRSVGRWEEAVVEYKQAMNLEPRNPGHAAEAGAAYSRLRRYEQSMAAWDKAIALAPDNYNFKRIKGHIFLRWRGTADTLKAALRQTPAAWDPNGLTTLGRYVVARIERNPVAALEALDASRHDLIFDGMQYWPRALLRAQTYEMMGDRRLALHNYKLALPFLADSIARHPDDARMRISLGLVYAGLKRDADAVSEARVAMELAPLTSNHLTATAIMKGAVDVFIAADATDAAFELLDLMFALPAGREVSVSLLRADPTYDPIRSDPRFEQMLARYSGDEP